jgi:hypothetical protein
VYDQLSRAHDGVAQFRAKLLALLPLASGTGFFAVLNIDPVQKSQHLLAIGLFGSLVSFALYMYEMRGIQRCALLGERARKLEHRLVGDVTEGAFGADHSPRFFLATNTWAARIVYPATMSVWAYVAFCGLDSRFEPVRIPLSLACFVILLAAGGIMSQSAVKQETS